MAVTATGVIENTELYIPASNGLTQTEMEKIATSLITKIGDDDANLPQISCEFLQQLADINDLRSGIDNAGLKSEKLGRRTLTYDTSSSKDGWKDYKTNVINNICPLLGVEKETSTYRSGVFISSGEKICINGTEYP